MESILTSIKKTLGIDEEYEHFDVDILMHINSVLVAINQLGIGPSTGFIVLDKTQTWAELLGDGYSELQSIQSYMYLKVRLLFDPPSNSFIVESMNRQIGELEWRLNVQVETTEEEV